MKSLIFEQMDMNVGSSVHYIPCPAKKKIWRKKKRKEAL
jgi:hypothetical protein